MPLRLTSSGSVKASPAPGSPIAAQSQIDIVVTVKYGLYTAESGTVVLIVQDDKHRPLIAKGRDQEQKDVPKGTGEVTLATTVPVLAKFKSLEVYIALVRSGTKSTDTTTHFVWPVQQR